MVPWVHISSQPDAYGSPGWLILPTRSAPALSQALGWLAPASHLRWLPHFNGWWLHGDATNALFSALDRSMPSNELCGTCAADGVPCEAAIATMLGRAQYIVDVSRMYEDKRKRDQEDNRRRATHGHFPPPSSNSNGGWRRSHTSRNPFAPPPAPTQTDVVSRAAATIGVQWPATSGQIQKAFRRSIAKAHPDMGGSPAAADAVIKARATLLDALR